MFAIGLLLTACDPAEPVAEAPSEAPPATETPPATPEPEPEPDNLITGKEWAFNTEALKLKAGEEATLTFRNDGIMEHSMVIEGLGVSMEYVQRGKEKVATVTPEPGTYEVVCTIPGHAEQGMRTTIVVE